MNGYQVLRLIYRKFVSSQNLRNTTLVAPNQLTMQHNPHAPTVPPTGTLQHSDLPMVMRLKRRLL